MNTEEQIAYLAARYSDCGMTVDKIRTIMADISGKDDRAKLIAIRLGLGMEFHKQELFCLDDVCHVSGMTRDEVMEAMQRENVSPMSVSFAPWLTGGGVFRERL